MEWWHTIELPGEEVTPCHHDYRGEKGKRFLWPWSESETGRLGMTTAFWSICRTLTQSFFPR